ncbi:unnamed protein product [Cladocopium goreaui]|uniref:RING-type domain-containing protein n=1 Tax=Cladocopium goreaui TaxID=2562237 RepID=A0A9P1D9R7_9DINO|nr:unnamed protein product [Cladocopium goreaui]
MAETEGLTVCHTARVALRAQLRCGEALGGDEEVADEAQTQCCKICGAAWHPCLAHASDEMVQAYDLLEVQHLGPLTTDWHEVPLASDLEGEPSMSSPLRICAALCAEEMDTSRSRKLSLELRVVADPLDLAQRSRFAIYPPWQLGPQLRFSWRLETRPKVEPEPTTRNSVPLRLRRPRSLPGIGGVSGGFGSGSSLDIDGGYMEKECTIQEPPPQPFQLLSNCLDAEAEVPDGLLLPLRQHQLQSLAWMQACEARSEPLLLGASREFLPAVQPPHAAQQILVEAVRCRGVARVQRAFKPKGGLLADHVGSGKTAVTLALVASDRGSAKRSLHRSLVLMPGRLLQQWQQEVTKFLEPGLVDVQLWDGREISDPGARPSLLLAPIELLSPKRRREDGDGTRGIADTLRSLSLSRIVVDEFHENLESALRLQELKDTETALWGLTGTPCLDDFTSVAKLVRACSDVDLLVFRRQLDAKDLAQRALDYLARANGDLKGLEVQEELVALYHTPAERAIYEGAAAARRRRSESEKKDETLGAELLQLCSHFRLHGPTDCDAETESAALLRRRKDACETSRAWLLLAAQRMEMHILQAQREGVLPTVVAEQYAQLLVEVDGKPYSGFAASEQLVSQVAGAKAARQGTSKRSKRHERDADDLILQAILEIRSGLAVEDWKESLEAVSSDTNALELLEEVKQAKEAFRQRSHEHAFLSAMLDAAEAQNFQCPVCLNDFPPTERAMLAACAHLFCLRCAGTLVRTLGVSCDQVLTGTAIHRILCTRY